MKFSIFTAGKNLCIFHGQVFVMIYAFFPLFTDTEIGSQTIVQQNRHKITATLGLVVHAAGLLVHRAPWKT